MYFTTVLIKHNRNIIVTLIKLQGTVHTDTLSCSKVKQHVLRKPILKTNIKVCYRHNKVFVKFLRILPTGKVTALFETPGECSVSAFPM